MRSQAFGSHSSYASDSELELTYVDQLPVGHVV